MAALAARGGRTSSNSGTGSPSLVWNGPNGQSPRPTMSAAPSVTRAAALSARARSRRRVSPHHQT